MKLWGIAITPTQPAPWHAARIEALLEAGCRFVHVRYPGAPAEAIARVIGGISPTLRSRLTIHDHFGQLTRQGVGGVHLNNRNPQPPAQWHGRMSRSLHSFDELLAAEAAGTPYDYVTLSPVYDSISKPGYTASAPLLDQMIEWGKGASDDRSLPVVAMGGITPARLPELAQIGFDGFAMLGSIAWNDTIEIFNNSIICYNS